MLKIEELRIGDYLSTKTDYIPEFPTNATLETVYKSMDNAGIPAIIKNEDEDFVGLVSLKKILYMNRSRFSTKSENAMFNPPFLTPEDTLEKGMKQMLALGLFVLPVFDPAVKDSKKILGFLDLYELIQEFRDFELTDVPQKPRLLNINSSVKEGYEILRNSKTARLIIIDEAGSLAGMVTKRSLADGLLDSVNRQRFSSKEKPYESLSFDTEKVFRVDIPIKNYMVNTEIIKQTPTTLGDISELYREKKINMLVLVDKNNTPLNILTLDSILKHILLDKEEIILPLTINGIDSLGNLQEEFQDNAESHFAYLDTPMDLRSLNIGIKTTSTDENKIIEYEIVVEATLTDGQVIIGKDNNPEAMTALGNCVEKIESQYRRAKDQMLSARTTATPMGG